LLRYNVTPSKAKEFEEYAVAWTRLITKFGGTHLGYFLPSEPPNSEHSAHFSFAGLGKEGPPNVAVAIYSFPDLEAYETYRRMAAEDEEVKKVTARFNETKCFTRYERNFVRRV
jgi:hypothetical protein